MAEGAATDEGRDPARRNYVGTCTHRPDRAVASGGPGVMGADGVYGQASSAFSSRVRRYLVPSENLLH